MRTRPCGGDWRGARNWTAEDPNEGWAAARFGRGGGCAASNRVRCQQGLTGQICSKLQFRRRGAKPTAVQCCSCCSCCSCRCLHASFPPRTDPPSCTGSGLCHRNSATIVMLLMRRTIAAQMQEMPSGIEVSFLHITTHHKDHMKPVWIAMRRGSTLNTLFLSSADLSSLPRAVQGDSRQGQWIQGNMRAH